MLFKQSEKIGIGMMQMDKPRAFRAALGALMLGALALGAPAGAQDRDRHIGYYYPPVTVGEVFEAGATTLTEANRVRRLGFVTLITAKLLSGSYPPQYVMFAKGANAEKLIIIGMGDYIGNVFQARALLAQLTAQARTTEVFRQVNDDGQLTFLDLLKMLGFEQVTVSDGKAFTLQIAIK